MAGEDRAQLLALLQRDIGNDNRRSTRGGGIAREAFEPVPIERIEVGKEYDARRYLRGERGDEREDVVDRHAGCKRACAGGGDRRAVGERVAVGNAELDCRRAAPRQRTYDGSGGLKIGISGHHIGNKCRVTTRR